MTKLSFLAKKIIFASVKDVLGFALWPPVIRSYREILFSVSLCSSHDLKSAFLVFFRAFRATGMFVDSLATSLVVAGNDGAWESCEPSGEYPLMGVLWPYHEQRTS